MARCSKRKQQVQSMGKEQRTKDKKLNMSLTGWAHKKAQRKIKGTHPDLRSQRS